MLLLHSDVSIVVERKKNSGLFGSVIVNYATLSPTETYPYIPANVLRADYADYDYSTGFVVFPTNSTTAAFNISTKANNQPELDQSVFARLTAVSLARGDQTRPGRVLIGHAFSCFFLLLSSSCNIDFLHRYNL